MTHGRRVRAATLIALFLPIATANTAACILCLYSSAHAMEWELAAGHTEHSQMPAHPHHCGPAISDGGCPGPELLIAALAVPDPVPAVRTVEPTGTTENHRRVPVPSMTLLPDLPPPRAQ